MTRTSRRSFLKVGATATAIASADIVLNRRPSWAPPKKPVVTTDAATNITSSGARLNGTVNPKGSATTYHFQYGLTVGYGSTTTTISAGSGNAAVPVFEDVSGLSASTLYHYRISATNAGGTSLGTDQTFTTNSFGGNDIWSDVWSDVW